MNTCGAVFTEFWSKLRRRYSCAQAAGLRDDCLIRFFACSVDCLFATLRLIFHSPHNRQMNLKRMFQSFCVALVCAGASLSAWAVLPTLPGSPNYTLTTTRWTAVLWRETLSDGKQYLLGRFNPVGTQRICTLSALDIVVDGFAQESVALYTDIPLIDANKPDTCNLAIAEPKTFVIDIFSAILNKSGWTPAKLQTIRYKENNIVVTSVILPVAGTAGGSLATAFNFSDAWYLPAESGWGILTAHHVDTGGQMVATFYVYDSVGNTKWYILSGGTWSGSVFSGDVYDATGYPGGFATLSTFKSANTKLTKVGTAGFDFKSRGNAVFNYTINGVVGSKAIERLQY
jgi:hypothetical protein